MITNVVAIIVSLSTAAALHAQYFVRDEALMRRVTRVSWHGESGEQFVAIEHGQPEWRPGHERFMDSQTMRRARLGNGPWTTLQTNVDLSFSDTRVPRGRGYLGVQCDERQDWQLTLMAADAVDAAGRGAFATPDIEPRFLVPLRLERSEAASELFEITLASQPQGEQNVALTIAWGNYRLHGAMSADFDRRRPEGAPEFAMSAPDQLVTTESGLRYEVLQAGSGAFPRATDRVTVHYTAWLTDGTQFDTSYQRGGEPRTFPLDRVVKGFAEGLRLMQPGAVFRLTIPPELGYGKAGIGDAIPQDATLVFTVTLLSIEE